MKPPTKKLPVAPAVYRPQPLPRVLQTKATRQAPVGSFAKTATANRPSTITTHGPRMGRACTSPSIQLAAASARDWIPTTTVAATTATAATPVETTTTSYVPLAPPLDGDPFAASIDYRKQNRKAYIAAGAKGLERFGSLRFPSPPPHDAQRRFREDYVTTADSMTGAVETNRLKKEAEGSTPITTAGYKSRVNITAREFTADTHVKSQEPNEISGSEIILGQYRHMAGLSGIHTTPHLRRLIRYNVTGPSGKPIVEYIHGSSDQLMSTKEFTPSDHEFYALLGIENLTSAVFLVRQHGAELGIAGIEKLTLAGSVVTVHFREAM